MARDLNKVMLIGRVGTDIELKRTDNNIAYLRFNLATNEVYKNEKGESVQKTEWHRVVMWGKLAEIASSLLKKGSHIYVEGKLNTFTYEKGTEKYTSTRINATDFILFDKKPVAEETPVSDNLTPFNEGSGGNNLPEVNERDVDKVSEANTNDFPDQDEPPF
ncbi:MAG: single-stranded DNA-binding protein [Ignavibacteria bacterium]